MMSKPKKNFRRKGGPVLALCATACVCFYLGLTLPLMTFETLFFFERDASLIDIIGSLWKGDSWPLALLVGAFSIGFPAAKLLYLTVGAMAPNLLSKTKTLSFLAQLSKWSMLDVLVVAIVIVATKTTGFAKAVAQPGLWFFALCVVLMAIATYLSGRKSTR